MASPYRPYILSDIIAETDDIRSFVCTPADGQPVPEFKAGQFFMLKLPDAPASVKPPFRPYSVARAYTPDKICFGIKLHTGFTPELYKRKKGDKVEISGPYGQFIVASDGPASSAPIVLLAAGIGITPLMCMAEELTRKKDARPIQLFYSNREPDDVAFIGVMEALASQNPNLSLITTLTCEPRPAGYGGECGRINEDLLLKHNTDFEHSHFYFCGPKAFMEAMTAMLEAAGVAKERIHKEAW